MKHFEKVLFFLFILSFPIQLGRHFWPPFSLIHGIRVDYLSPTIYVSDLFFVLLLLFSFPRLYRKFFSLVRKHLIVFTIATLLLSTFFSQNTLLSLMGLVKFFEFFYVAFYVCWTIKKSNWKKLVFLFAAGAAVESAIIIIQVLIQHSIGGPLYFLGERTFFNSTPGVATFQMNGNQTLRGYGTFPHPNVAAFYLLVGFIFILVYRVRNQRIKPIKVFVLAFIFLGIVATFARIVILLVIAAVILETLIVGRKKKGKGAVVTVGTVVAFILVGLLLIPRFVNGIIGDWILRTELFTSFFQIFLRNLLFGVGFNNYFLFESSFQKTVSPILLQPVHNIYLLWIVQTGVGGVVVLITSFKVLYKRIRNNMEQFNKKNAITRSALLLIIVSLVIGLFDHYLLTLQQGQLLFAFVLGLVFVNSKG